MRKSEVFPEGLKHQYLPNFEDVIEYFKTVYDNVSLSDKIPIINYILLFSYPVLGYHILYLLKNQYALINRIIQKTEYIFYGIMIFMILTNAGSPGDFIYFQF